MRNFPYDLPEDHPDRIAELDRQQASQEEATRATVFIDSQSVEREIGEWPNGWLEYYWFEARNMAGGARVCMKGEGRIHGAVLIPEGDREYILTNLESLIQFLEAEYGGPQ